MLVFLLFYRNQGHIMRKKKMIFDNFYMGIYFCIYPKYSDKEAWANGVDPDQMQNVACDQGQHCLPLIQQFLDSKSCNEIDFFFFFFFVNFRTGMINS